MKTVISLMLLFPLAGALTNALWGRLLSRKAVSAVACGVVIGSLAASVTGLISGPSSMPFELFQWIAAGDFHASFTLLYDPTAAVMTVMVTFVASIIHIYSIAFMRDDPDYTRYFVYMNLFVLAMLVIALADDLIFVYLGWEGVGFCSYALIGFWYTSDANANAGKKAFILTRIGDVAFGIALAIIFLAFGDFSITHINTNAQNITTGLATLLGLLLLWAAIGKSAQLPLSVWLPDAMAGPTPVSALIHAATMVTAGAYLLIRLFPLLRLSPSAMLITAVIGAVTGLYSALAALAQTDIKRILAYSTMSQVSYMFMAIGAGDIVGSLFLLVSHAFFKALLFLGAGCVIQALDEEHDIFKMGNIRKHMPVLYWLFLAGALCLSAFPLIGGFFSKDRILIAMFLHPDPVFKLLWMMAALGAFLTPLYTMRLFFVAFPARPQGQGAETFKPVPGMMIWILWPLAILALFDGLLNLPFGPGKRWLAHYLSTVPGAVIELNASTALEWIMGVGDALMVVGAIALSYILFRKPEKSGILPEIRELLLEGFYLDRLYHTTLVLPYKHLSRFLWNRVDTSGLDQGIMHGAGNIGYLAGIMNRWNTGNLSSYLKAILLGFAGVLLALILGLYGR